MNSRHTMISLSGLALMEDAGKMKAAAESRYMVQNSFTIVKPPRYDFSSLACLA